jgi:hypothetical protein
MSAPVSTKSSKYLPFSGKIADWRSVRFEAYARDHSFEKIISGDDKPTDDAAEATSPWQAFL